MRRIFVIFFFLFGVARAGNMEPTSFVLSPPSDPRLQALGDIQSVHVAGSFNDWSSTADPLNAGLYGTFRTEISLAPGLYHYKFVINGQLWLEDLNANPAFRQDDGQGVGQFNSGVQINAPGDDEGPTGAITDVPRWAMDAIWYQVFPERFRNGDRSNDPTPERSDAVVPSTWTTMPWGKDWYSLEPWETTISGGFFGSVFQRRYGGDLQGIIDKLDYLKELGITALYINPLFRSPSLHKYDAETFHHIDENFGPDPEGDRRLLATVNETEDSSSWVWTSADKLFLELINQVHRRGMKIIIDGVFNHSGRGFFAFQDLVRRRGSSRYASWYDVVRWDDSLPDGFEYRGWFGVASLPQFRRDSENVDSGYKAYVFDITKRWLAPGGDTNAGIDGWRLDVAYCLPHGFWRDWRRHVKSIKSDSYLTGEVVDIAPSYLQGQEFDGLMNYPFAYTATEFLIDKRTKITASEFVRRLTSLHDSYPRLITHAMQNLLSSHDTARLATIIRNPDLGYRDFGGFFNRTKINVNHDIRLDRGGLAQRNVHKLIVLLQMTWIGAPMIYYGDEVGMTGANDPDSRKPMLWDDLDYEDEVAHPIPGMSKPAEKNRIDNDLLNFYRSLIAVRNSHPSLRRGNFRIVLADDSMGVVVFERSFRGERTVVIINSSDISQHVSFEESGVLDDLLQSGVRLASVDGRFSVPIDAHTGRVFGRKPQ